MKLEVFRFSRVGVSKFVERGLATRIRSGNHTPSGFKSSVAAAGQKNFIHKPQFRICRPHISFHFPVFTMSVPLKDGACDAGHECTSCTPPELREEIRAKRKLDLDEKVEPEPKITKTTYLPMAKMLKRRAEANNNIINFLNSISSGAVNDILVQVYQNTEEQGLSSLKSELYFNDHIFPYKKYNLVDGTHTQELKDLAGQEDFEIQSIYPKDHKTGDGQKAEGIAFDFSGTLTRKSY